MSAASPGVISVFFRNDHYPSEEAYLYAIAEAMRAEYEAVAKAGFVLQIDCPDLAMGKHIKYYDVDLATFRKAVALNIEAMNHATANIPAEQLRMHVCWGNYEGPHHYDVPLADVIDLVFKARASYISFEAANPRHAHEWTLFEKVKLPDGKVLIPGVIESKANFIEHPELIAQRIGRYAKLVGRENVMAGSDCGYGTWVGQAAVDPDVVLAKFAALAEGARIASKEFWKYHSNECRIYRPRRHGRADRAAPDGGGAQRDRLEPLARQGRAADRRRHDMGGHAARRRREMRDRVLDRDRRRGGARGRARRRRRARRPQARRHLCRHEHDQRRT